MAETVTLKIDGQAFDGWESLSIKRSLNALCASFDLELTDRMPGRVDRRAISDQAACEVHVGGDLLITGWIYDIDRNTTERQRTIKVSGRDRTADIIDCSALHKPGSWANLTLDKIAAELLAPFGLTLALEAKVGAPFTKFALEQGESVFDAITRMCRMRGVMLKSNRAGQVVVFKPVTESSGRVLEVGKNLTSLSTRSSTEARFSDYIVKGQHHGGQYTAAKAAAGPKGTAEDAGIDRYRPIVIISDEQASASGLRDRALWEATSRLGEAQKLTASCAGWRWDDGQLFEPDTIVRVISALDGIDDDFMVADVDLALGGGTTARLGLVRPEAYAAQALLEAKQKKAKKKGGLDYLGALTNG